MRGRVAYAAFEAFPNRKGAGARMTNMLSALAEAGYEVHLMTLPPRVERSLPEGIVHHVLRANSHNYLERACMFRDQVARRLHSVAPDVVHVRGIFEGQAAAQYAAQRGRPFIFEVNGLPSVELRYHYRRVAEETRFEARLRAQEGALLACATEVITQSHTTQRFLQARGLPAGKSAHVIPNGADPAAWRSHAARPKRDFLQLLYAGTLSAWQGVAELLMALRRARRQHAFRLTIAGHASKRRMRELTRVVRRLKLHDIVELTGALEPDALAQRVKEADICVAPLRRDLRNIEQGCSPIKLFEYMAAGRAIITTDMPCVREIVEPDETAAMVHAPHPSRLAEQLVRLASAPALRERLGRQAQAKLQAHATWSHRRRALLSVYEALEL